MLDGASSDPAAIVESITLLRICTTSIGAHGGTLYHVHKTPFFAQFARTHAAREL